MSQVIFPLIISGIIAFVLGIKIGLPERDDAFYNRILNEILNKYEGILARANGDIGGIVLDDDESYQDRDLDVERERLRYIAMDGEIRVEPRDGFNPKRGRLQPLVKVKPNSSGIYLTEILNPKTEDRIPVAKGKRIENLEEEADNLAGVKQEVNEMSNEYTSMKSKLKNIEDENARIREEKEQLNQEIQDYGETNMRLRSLVKSYAARVEGAEAKNHMLETELKKLSERYDNVQDDVDEILNKARKRFEKSADLGAMEDMPNLPNLPEPEEGEEPPKAEEAETEAGE